MRSAQNQRRTIQTIMAALTLAEALIFTFVGICLVLWLVEYAYIAFVRHARREPPTPEAVATLRDELRRKLDDEKRAECASAVGHPRRCVPTHAAPAKTPDLEAPPTSSASYQVHDAASQRWAPCPSRGSGVSNLPTIAEEGSCHNTAPSEESLDPPTNAAIDRVLEAA
jgi:hypothetical protein